MTPEDYGQLQADMERQARAVREALAEDLGGEPEDYRVDRAAVTDGGDGE